MKVLTNIIYSYKFKMSGKSNVTDMSKMVGEYNSLTEIDISSKVTDMSKMFCECTSLKGITFHAGFGSAYRYVYVIIYQMILNTKFLN